MNKTSSDKSRSSSHQKKPSDRRNYTIGQNKKESNKKIRSVKGAKER